VLTPGAPRRGGRTASQGGPAGFAGLPAALAAAALAAAVSFAGIGSHSLWTPDEPRDAAIGKAMWASGDLVVPRLDGRPFLEKPPLAWWAQAAAFQTLGVSDAAARVPSALFGTLTLLTVWSLGRRLGGARAGWLAAAALASTAQYGEDMRRAIVDPPLVLAVTMAWAGFVLLVAPRQAGEGVGGAAGGGRSRAVEDGEPGGGRSRAGPWAASLLIACAVPVAFLSKGVVGIGLALGPPVIYLLATGVAAGRAASPRGGPASTRRDLAATLRLLAPLAVLGVPLFAAVVLPWALALLREAGWPALRETLVGNTVGRLLATEAGRAYGHRQPFWYYLPAGAAALLPWTLALPALLRGTGGFDGRATSRESGTSDSNTLATAEHEAARQAVSAEAAEDARRLLIASFFIGVALLSLAASKRSLYLVPLMPGLAIPVGLWLDRLGRDDESRWDRRTALALLALAALLPPVLWLGGWAAFRGVFHSFPVGPLRAQLTTGHLAAAGGGAAAAAVMLLHRFARHLRAGTTPAGAWLVIPYLALALVYQTAIKAVIDPLKNLHDLTTAIARLDPGPGPVVAYRPSETTLGIVEFDLGRGVRALSTPAEMAAFFADRPTGRLVLSIDALRHLPPDLRAHLRLLYDESATKASPYGIAAWGT
jgi:4-amino-4-deoxy-L-arabinose transferase-like glycosyltransferase